MGAGLRARGAAPDRAAHGLDQLRRHEAAAPPVIRHRGGGGRLLRAPRHSVPGVRGQGTQPPHHGVCRQLRLHAPRTVDALNSTLNNSFRRHCRPCRASTPGVLHGTKAWDGWVSGANIRMAAPSGPPLLRDGCFAPSSGRGGIGAESVPHPEERASARVSKGEADAVQLSPRIKYAVHPSALSVLPPAVTGLASTSAKAIWHGSLPLLTQLWMVPRCTSTSPALRWTLVPSSSMSISPFITTAKSMESVRWLRGATPGPNSTTRNTQPPGSVVATLRVEESALPSLFTGKPSVVQITVPCWFGRLDVTFFDTSSMITRARPCSSWPVTTRRTFKAISFLLSAFRGGR